MGKLNLNDLKFLIHGGAGLRFDAENRVNKAYDLSLEHNDAGQTSGAGQPHRTRDDERMNLVLQSVLPGTLGATEPDGWDAQDNNGEIVESDDPSYGHQAHLQEPSNQRSRLRQSVSLLEGQELLLGYYVEDANYVSGNVQTVSFGGIFSASTLSSNDNFANFTPGQWVWRAAGIGSSSSGFVTVGAGTGASTTGTLKLSRPFLIYMPSGWLSWTEPQRQQWLTDHYAATTTLRQYAGKGDVRAVHLDGVSHYLDTNIIPESLAQETGEMFIFAMFRPLSTNNAATVIGERTNPTLFGIRHGTAGQVQISYRADGGTVFSDTISVDRNEYCFVSGGWSGGTFRLFVNGNQEDERSYTNLLDSTLNRQLQVGNQSTPFNFELLACGIGVQAPSPAQHAALAEIFGVNNG